MRHSSLDVLWVLMAAGLVFLMQAGFMCLETGLTRSKNSINVAIKNLADFVVAVLTFWGLGFGIMFGASQAGLVGADLFLYPMDDAWGTAFFFFQAMFCGTAVTIFSGAVAERMRFSAYFLLAFLVSVLIYPVFGHWAWGGLLSGEAAGWLERAGFVDFAGSTVVHSVGGWVSLAALVVIGPRMGRFGPDGPREIVAGNLPLTVLGVFLLWFGWFGFNGGSTLAMSEDVAGILARTTLAGAMGGVVCLALAWLSTGLARVEALVNGLLGGLVAITANCHCVGALESALVGAVAGVVVLVCERLLLRLRIDDAVGAVPVHLGCGVWGTLAVALFGNPEILGTGLDVAGQFVAQLEGVLAAFVVSFLFPLALFKGINRIMPLRVTPEEEDTGLNVSEHGARTELLDLFQVMDVQARAGDLSLRAPEEPFTEVGHIARRYNQVMDALEQAMAKTEAVISTAADAIVTFGRDSLEILTANPSASSVFGRSAAALVGLPVSDLVAGGLATADGVFSASYVEIEGLRGDGTRFPMEAIIQKAGRGADAFYIGSFRDISERKHAERVLRESEERYRSFFENTGTAIFIDEPDGMISLVNAELARLVGRDPAEIEGRMNFRELFTQGTLAFMDEYHHLRRVDPSLAPTSYEAELLDKDGQVVPVWVTASMIMGSDRCLVSLMDVSNLRSAQLALGRQRAWFSQLFENSPQAIVMVDIDGRVLHVNRGFEILFGRARGLMRGELLANRVTPAHLREESESFQRMLFLGKSLQSETERLHADGRLVPVSVLGYPIRLDGKVTGAFLIYSDISERKAFERQLTHQAFHDSLTGLPNRALFMERLSRAVERSKRRSEYSFAVLLVDLDRFKWINDSLGHQAGDELLKGISRRLQATVRTMDTVARLGGDEFALLLEEFRDNQEVIGIVKRLQQVVSEPFTLEGNEVWTSASIGVVLKTKPYAGPQEILRDADIAMYRAKELGKARFKVFSKKMHQQAVEVLRLESELRRAVQEGGLEVHYQPIVSLGSQERLEGFEALVRWNHPVRGMVAPAEFIPLAEETGLIVPLGHFVLEQACRQLAEWRGTLEPGRELCMSVNISSKQLLQDDLPDYVAGVLKRSELPPACLKLEITESVIMQDARSTVEKLNRLKALGVKLVIDDFGTGYSSLSYLQRFPIDGLKIDRSFVSGLRGEGGNSEIVRTIMALARNLGLDVVAEGVEQQHELDALRGFECHEAQGYIFSRPVDSREAGELIRKLGRP